MKIRKHHNNKGYYRIKKGWQEEQLKLIAKKLGIPYGKKEKTDKNIL